LVIGCAGVKTGIDDVGFLAELVVRVLFEMQNSEVVYVGSEGEGHCVIEKQAKFFFCAAKNSGYFTNTQHWIKVQLVFIYLMQNKQRFFGNV
jgi:hypothetical protein